MIDLHLHLDGSLSIGLIESLAKQQHITLPEPLLPSIQASPRCQDLNEYLRCFDLPFSCCKPRKPSAKPSRI